MTTNATPCTAAGLAEELQTREARLATLRHRLADVSRRIEQLDETTARALAEGTEAPSDVTERQSLVAERDRTTRALTLLEGDVAQLRAEGQSLALAEAVEEGRRCVTVASERAEALEARIGEMLAAEIFPRAAELEEALSAARAAESRLTALHSGAPGRTAQLTEQRVPLFAFLAQCHLYAERVGRAGA